MIIKYIFMLFYSKYTWNLKFSAASRPLRMGVFDPHTWGGVGLTRTVPLSLCQSLLIDPSTGYVVDIDFDLDSLILNQTSFNYIKQNFDLFEFKDPASKSRIMIVIINIELHCDASSINEFMFFSEFTMNPTDWTAGAERL